MDHGESKASIALRLELSERTVYRYAKRRREGLPLEPARSGPTGPVKLTRADDQVLLDAVAQRPGVTAQEVMPELSVPVVESTVCRPRKWRSSVWV